MATISEASKRMWAKLTPEERSARMRLISLKAADARRGKPNPKSEIARQRMVAALNTPEFKAKKSAEVKQYFKDHPEAVEARRAQRKLQNDDPVFREKARAANLGRKQSPETIAKRSAAMKARWADPAYKEHALALRRTPEWRQSSRRGGLAAMAKMTDAERQAWTLSGYRAAKDNEGPTSIEVKSRNALDTLDVLYETDKVIGWYHPDLFIEPNIIIECDGIYWHNKPGAAEYDRKRDASLRKKGYIVIRVGEEEINADPIAAMQRALEMAGFYEGRLD